MPDIVGGAERDLSDAILRFNRGLRRHMKKFDCSACTLDILLMLFEDKSEIELETFGAELNLDKTVVERWLKAFEGPGYVHLEKQNGHVSSASLTASGREVLRQNLSVALAG